IIEAKHKKKRFQSLSDSEDDGNDNVNDKATQRPITGNKRSSTHTSKTNPTSKHNGNNNHNDGGDDDDDDETNDDDDDDLVSIDEYDPLFTGDIEPTGQSTSSSKLTFH